MISLHAKNLESALLADPHVAVMFSCPTLTRSAKVFRTEFPSFLAKNDPNSREKEGFATKPLLTAMAQVLPSPIQGLAGCEGYPDLQIGRSHMQLG